jgi:uncharacterized membrane protein
MRDRRRKPDQDLFVNLRTFLIILCVMAIIVMMLLEKIFHADIALHAIPILLAIAIGIFLIEVWCYIEAAKWLRGGVNRFKTWIRWPVYRGGFPSKDK